MKRLVLFLCLACLGHLSAQDTPRSDEHVNLKFTVVGWGDAFENLAYRQNGTLKKLGHVPIFARSDVFEYSGPVVFELYKTPSAAASASDPSSRPSEPQASSLTASQDKKKLPVATVLLPTNAKRVMILVSAQNDRYQMMVVPDELDEVPSGQAKLINLSPSTVAIQTNKKDSFTLGVQQNRLVSPNPDGLMQMQIAFKAGSEWKKADNTFLRLPKDYRTVVFFLKSNSAYFKDVDGKTTSLIETVVMREPLAEPSASSRDK